MKKATIKRGFIREIQTKQFEQFKVIAEDSVEFEYTKEEERVEAEKQITDRILKDFIKSYNMACETLGIDRCISVVTAKKPATNSTKTIKKPELRESDSEFDFFNEDEK